ncbi:MAG: hypothetical protein ACI93R_002980 [Flavobacteriales bacterium]|jgi:hypothetical protein
MKTFAVVVIVLITIVGGSYVLATTGASEKSGYAEVNFEGVSGLSNKLSLDVGPLGVMPIKWALGLSEQKEFDVLKDVDGVQLKIYEVDGDVDEILSSVDHNFKALKSQGWETVVSINEEREKVRLLTSTVGNTIQGATLFVLNENEAIFLNVLGRIAEAQLSQLMEMQNQK